MYAGISWIIDGRGLGSMIDGRVIVVSHLQYADDTLFIKEATMENLWSIKLRLESFSNFRGIFVGLVERSEGNILGKKGLLIWLYIGSEDGDLSPGTRSCERIHTLLLKVTSFDCVYNLRITGAVIICKGVRWVSDLGVPRLKSVPVGPRYKLNLCNKPNNGNLLCMKTNLKIHVNTWLLNKKGVRSCWEDY
ncbi:hypothetical protein MTR_8g078485 [Medicago truncatula]|uniref:Uncharacterized protein n=1 Tax=Medicago truncatula TaxID=3880 RepID=A0A072TSR2_MEDTR|nr:hypothetical protein MTR_8g078485 [Medicago truncatula]